MIGGNNAMSLTPLLSDFAQVKNAGENFWTAGDSQSKGFQYSRDRQQP